MTGEAEVFFKDRFGSDRWFSIGRLERLDGPDGGRPQIVHLWGRFSTEPLIVGVLPYSFKVRIPGEVQVEFQCTIQGVEPGRGFSVEVLGDVAMMTREPVEKIAAEALKRTLH